jgi:16S rRNA (guanine527-N7)-methyltransferase
VNDGVADGLAEEVFGERVHLARRYADLLCGDGISRGLLGPREADRIWDRHLFNCAVLTELLPVGARIVDVGSGAGLPGVVLAIRRPDLRVDLVDSLQRRVDFLTRAVEDLGLAPSVRVIRGRAEDGAVRSAVGDAEWVTARAVAPLDRLVGWCMPLLRPDGRLIAMKGASAAEEMRQARPAAARAGGCEPELVMCGVGVIDEPVPVIVVRRAVRRAQKGTR